jgi:Flp pilus assembly protein TadG
MADRHPDGRPVTGPADVGRRGQARWRGLARTRGRLGDDRGQLTVVVALLTPLLVGGGWGLLADGGHALAARGDAIDTAAEAARAGAQGLDLGYYRASGKIRLDPADADQRARRFLAQVGAQGTVTATPRTVTVTVTRVVNTQLLALLGVATLTEHGTASAVPVSTLPAANPGGGGP